MMPEQALVLLPGLKTKESIMKIYKVLILFVLLIIVHTDVAAQKKRTDTKTEVDVARYGNLNWRSIGPYRGGRAATITGVSDQPNLFYMGTTGGGVWRTTDGGQTWHNLSDGFFGGSIGAVAVSEWDPNVLYVGGGEKTVRGNVSYGYGVWKTEDAGKTWTQVGLKNARHIPRLRIHPKNPQLVYAAVLGDLYKSSEQRGVYRSKDGGNTWERVLYANADAGAVDLVMDPNNPRILYAATWRIRRTPYSLESGGQGSSIWKSTDGGDTWVNLKNRPGLPGGTWGISGITVSPKNSDRIWAIIENENGGVFRSDDAGETWELMNKERSLRQRAWYYTRIYADTEDEDQVYVLNVNYHHSKDGGKNFENFAAPHGDHHDLWIAPEDHQRMAIADDGGGQISFDGGQNWSTYHNQPTAQFYRVTTDNAFPYRIYGAQQDNSTVRIAHRTGGHFIGDRDWEPTAGGESAHLAPHPANSEVVYGGSYGGYMTRVNHETEEVWAVNVWPDNPMGKGAESLKYRFQWNYPIFFSPHDANKLYAASNYLHVSTDEGQSWQVISPDLTRNDKSKLGPSGGPITKDNTSVEYYCTIFAAVESPHEKGIIWVGSDDGLVHLTKDGGNSWNDVTPKELPEWSMINSLEVDPFHPGGMYLAATRYKWGDYQPLLFKTKDYGSSWEQITQGINPDHFTRVVRADPVFKGLLYAGTESGVYVSFNDGASWQSLQNNLPQVPITDLAVKNNNLIAATQGRSFWILDDLTVLHQQMEARGKDIFLFKPLDSYRMGGGNGDQSKTAGTNHPGGVLTYFYLSDTTNMDTLRIDYLTANGEVIRSFSTKPNTDQQEQSLDISPGLNGFHWNMRYPGAISFDGLILWGGNISGPLALPGTYQVRLRIGTRVETQNFNLIKDPRSSASDADLRAQFDLLQACIEKLNQTHQTIKHLRTVKKQLAETKTKLSEEGLKEEASVIVNTLTDIEEALYQTKNESNQDPLNFPIRLNNRLSALANTVGFGDHAPTEQAKVFFEEVSSMIETQLNEWENIRTEVLPAFNQKVYQAKIDAVTIPD